MRHEGARSDCVAGAAVHVDKDLEGRVPRLCAHMSIAAQWSRHRTVVCPFEMLAAVCFPRAQRNEPDPVCTSIGASSSIKNLSVRASFVSVRAHRHTYCTVWGIPGVHAAREPRAAAAGTIGNRGSSSENVGLRDESMRSRVHTWKTRM